MDAHDRINNLFHADALDFISRKQIHDDGVSGASDGLVEALDGGEGLLEAVPLGLVLFAALGLGEGVGEGGVVLFFFRQGGKSLDEVFVGAWELGSFGGETYIP
jgi:hypothetical protein